MTETSADRPRSTTILDNALDSVDALDPDLAAVLRREIDDLREGRKFGLVFNRHLPESVRLPKHPVKRGVRVALRNPSAGAPGEKDATWRVARVERAETGERVAWLHGEDAPRLVEDLVVVRDFGEPVYPGLKSVERIENGKPGDPWHLVLNAENHHALQALRFTHRGKVDLIYIDPPYNTGNQGWIYNDRYVDVSRDDSSSKWLSFMERRLLIARDLLKDTGVIIVAIGDDEHHRLRMLMDQVFGAQNFISDVVWQGGRKNDSRYVSNGADYMLLYARSEETLSQHEVRWRERKEGIDEVLTAAGRCWEESDGSAAEATRRFRAWWRSLPPGHPSLGSKHYDRIDDAARPGLPYFADNMRSPNPRPNLCYDLIHPTTGEACNMHPNGWVYARDRMERLVADGRIHFGKDHATRPNLKRFLDESADQVPLESFYMDRRAASARLQAIFGDKRFPNPKDHEVLMRWFRMAAPKDAVVLDFFGGSGSTTEAVLRLNAEDGGTRQSILVTNNEVAVTDAKRLTKDGHVPGDPEWEARGVFEYVTRPRISTVVTGTREDGTTYTSADGKVGLAANVEFFEMTYLDETRVSRSREFEAIAPLLWAATGARGARIDEIPACGWTLPDDATYGLLAEADATSDFLAALASRLNDPDALAVTHVFVVTDSDSHFEDVSENLPSTVRAVRLYEAYLHNFQINTEVNP